MDKNVVNAAASGPRKSCHNNFQKFSFGVTPEELVILTKPNVVVPVVIMSTFSN